MTADRASSRRLATVSDAFRTRLWPVPAAGVVVAVVAGVLVPRLDARLDSTLQEHVSGYLFGGGAEAARSVLTVVASSMITVTALTFSLTVVALQLAGSQYSPRVLRTFASDAAVRWTLALFVATFIYALTVLRTVRGQAEGHTEFVPAMAVSVAYLLTVASVVALVVFLSHLSTKIRVETMMRVVHDEASTTIGVLQPRGHTVPVPPVPADAHVLVAGSSGFLTSIDEAGLVKAAIECAMVVQIDRSPGNSLVAGTPVGRFWSADRPVISSLSQQEAMQAASANALRTGFERTASQDIGFGLRQLTDIAVKALSPGINDPTTAVHALGHSSALLCSLAGTSLGARVLPDPDGRTRVVLTGPDLADLLDLAIAQPRRYGAGDPAVLSRLFALLGEVAWVTDDPAHRVAIGSQLTRLRSTVARQSFDPTEVHDLDVLARGVEEALKRR